MLDDGTFLFSANNGVGTGGLGDSMNWGPRAAGPPRVVGTQKIFRQDS